MRISIPVNKTPIIVSGFPGIGKSWLKSNTDLAVSDSDSSKWSKSNFPDNYLKYISDLYLSKNFDVILVSTHSDVRAGMARLNMPFFLIYPSLECKAEYMERYKQRGSPEGFLQLMDKQWENFVEGCMEQNGCVHIVLDAGEYLSDVYPKLNADTLLDIR